MVSDIMTSLHMHGQGCRAGNKNMGMHGQGGRSGKIMWACMGRAAGQARLCGHAWAGLPVRQDCAGMHHGQEIKSHEWSGPCKSQTFPHLVASYGE